MNDNTPSHRDNLHSFAESFYCPLINHNDAPPSQQQQHQQQPRKKAKRRRKRHAPPGPAGVWFQSQLVSNNNNNHHNTHDSSFAYRHEETAAAAAAAAAPDVSSCPAWMCMQFSLQLCTPYLPRHYSVQQRFQHLRAYIPHDYILLPEILNPCSTCLHLQDKKLLVLVHAAAVSYHSYWTVELRDECGASIKAWMDPLLEETEIVGMLQMGVVWLLQHLVVLVDDDSQQKWLLLSKSCIQRVWTPQEASNEFSDQQYIEWMTKRSLLNSNETLPTSSSSSSSTSNQERTMEQQEDEEEREVIDVEQEEMGGAIVPRHVATSRSVVTPRLVATTSSSSDAQRQSANANVVNNSSNIRATAELLQGVSDMPRVATSGDARRVGMSQQPRASIGGGVTNPPSSVVAASQNVLSQSASHSTTRQPSPSAPSVSNPYANKARNTQQQGETSTASSLSVNQTITVRQTTTTTTTTTSALTSREQLQPDSCTLSQSLALPNKKDTHESSSKSLPPPIDFSQFRSPTAKCNTSRTLTTNTQPASTAASMTNNPTKSKESMAESQFGNDTSESSPLQTKSTAFSKSPRPSPHCHSQSSFLIQFAAGLSQTDAESPNLSQDSPENTQKSLPPNKQTLTKRSKQQRTPVSKSPKELSNLWRRADACILEMLDDDDDDDDGAENQINSLPKSSFLTRQETTVTKETPTKETIQQESTSLAVDQEASSSLFQASAFAGMDMDNLFDE
jgi:hypothetical protein